MPKTKSEKLLDRIGQPVECEVCNRQKPFTGTWFMTEGKVVVCPECRGEVSKSGKVLVNI